MVSSAIYGQLLLISHASGGGPFMGAAYLAGNTHEGPQEADGLAIVDV